MATKLLFLIFGFLLAITIFMIFRAKGSCRSGLKDILIFDNQLIDKKINNMYKNINNKLNSFLSDNIKSQKEILELFDSICYDYSSVVSAIHFTTNVSTSKDLIDYANLKVQEASNWFTEHISLNPLVYKKLNNLFEKEKNNLDLIDYNFLENTLLSFKKNGAHLDESARKELLDLTRELTELCIKFQRNSIEIHPQVIIKKEDLEGIPDDFIQALPFNGENLTYTLPLDYPTQYMVLSKCKNKNTRKEYHIRFSQRGYPENSDILKKIQEIRHKIANLVGFENYTIYDLDGTMASKKENAEALCMNVLELSRPLAQIEKDAIYSRIPSDILLNDETNELDPEDVGYAIDYIKKTFYNVDSEKIAEYFPAEQTVKNILDFYGKLFSITFKKQQKSSWWYVDDLEVIDLYDQKEKHCGTIMLDLYPRPLKYSHACFCNLTEGFNNFLKKSVPMGAVICNFTKPLGEKPSLLKFGEVNTFFHELGHALHHMFGITRYASQAGTNVKSDFVEVPSQMFERYLDIKKVLQDLSGHYKTNEKLASDLIDRMFELDRLDRNLAVQRQMSLSLLALKLFESPSLDAKELYEEEFKKIISLSYLRDNNYFVCSFGHLTSGLYGAKYYAYMWALVYALDIFQKMREGDVIDPLMGKRLKDIILSQGGQKDPNLLIKDFLGRESSLDALKDYLEYKI